MIDLGGKTVLVTGGSRGIGAAIVRAVAGAGATMLLHYGRSREAAEAVRDSVGRAKCKLIQADLAEIGAASDLWQAATEAAGRIDVLVNNAGIFEAVPIDSSSEAWRNAWSRVLQVNLHAPAELCKLA
ncbi:MAG TPA: SDR family NAD(P)-dependent oxidoreductase, partial [Dongiaceae bacterium]|nr:SDR family NAD(P)-dependent oxidoreductase [Dongiaceae bacterium]